MNIHFGKNKVLIHRPSNIKVNNPKTTKYETKSLRSLGPHIWNSLPTHVKEKSNLKIFKEFISQWFGPSCKCSMCAFLTLHAA